MLEISDHGNEDAPSFYLLTDSEESAAFSVINFDWLKSLSHLFNLVFHLVDIHLGPFEFHVVIKSVLTFFDVFPQFFHPSDFNINGVKNLSTACSLAFGKFKHLFIVAEFVKPITELFDIFFSCFDVLETSLNAGIIEIECFSLKS